MNAERIAELTAQLAWLRRLARAIAGDAGDDLAHDTWLVAASGVPDDRPLRPWLSRVARNLAAMQLRSSSRRVRREQGAIALAEPSSPDALVARAESQRALVDAVLALVEPFRSTVLLRYFEELTSAQIARRLDVPEGTVRRRLKEALDRLRASLGADSRRRARLLAPLLVPVGRTRAPFALGAIAMKKLLLVLAILAIIVVCVVGRPWRSRTNAVSRSEASVRPWPVNAQRSDHREVEPSWFAAFGAPPRPIAGRVTLDGAPVANAVVTLDDPLTHAGAREPARVRTDATGHFAFGIRPPCTSYEIAASAPGRTAALEHIDSSNPTVRVDQLELRLRSCTASVAGTIYDASGNALAHAHVMRDGIVGSDSDDRGSYRVCLPHGPNEVTYSADGYGAVTLSVDAIGDIRRDVVLVPEAAIAGRVVDESGHPVSSALVRAFSSSHASDRPTDRSTISDGDGRFRLDRLVPEHYAVEALDDGGRSESIGVVARVGGAEPIVLRMASRARVRGKVTSGGLPVAGATIRAITAKPVRYSLTATSQSDGSFVLDQVMPGVVSFVASPYRVISPNQLAVVGDTVVALEVDPLATIRGRVTRDGQNVADARVCCVRTGATPDGWTMTDATGAYEFDGVAPGNYHLVAQSGELGAFDAPTTVDLAGTDVREVDLVLDLAASISGTVVDADSKPVPGALVRWTHEATGDLGKCITDASGRYRCDSMTGGGTYRGVVVPGPNQRPYPTVDGAPYPEIELHDGTSHADNVTLEIDAGTKTVSGHVTDDTSAPIADAIVRAAQMTSSGRAPNVPSWTKLPTTYTDGDGAFTLGGLTDGEYAISAHTGDGGNGVALHVVAGATSASVRIVRPGSIAGTLTNYGNVPAVYVSSVRAAADPSRADRVDTASFRSDGLEPGRYLVGAQSGDDGDATVVDVTTGQTSTVGLTARGHASVDVTVRDFATHAPIAGAACRVTVAAGGLATISDWDSRTSPTTDATGRASLPSVPSGPVQVLCSMPSITMSTPSVDVVLSAGTRVAVELLSVVSRRWYPTTIGVGFDWRTSTPRIASSVASAPGAQAGLQLGDIVTRIGDTSVAGLNGAGVWMLLSDHDAGASFQVTVERGGQSLTVQLAGVPESYQ